MPILTRLFVRSSFIYLILGLLTGTLLALQPYLKLSLPAMFPVYFHLLVIGWLTSLIFGIVYWMFPKYTIQKPRRSELLGWATFIFLNLGLILRAVAEPLSSFQTSPFWNSALVISALFQWLSAIGFVINTWGRVKER